MPHDVHVAQFVTFKSAQISSSMRPTVNMLFKITLSPQCSLALSILDILFYLISSRRKYNFPGFCTHQLFVTIRNC